MLKPVCYLAIAASACAAAAWLALAPPTPLPDSAPTLSAPEPILLPESVSHETESEKHSIHSNLGVHAGVF